MENCTNVIIVFTLLWTKTADSPYKRKFTPGIDESYICLSTESRFVYCPREVLYYLQRKLDSKTGESERGGKGSDEKGRPQRESSDKGRCSVISDSRYQRQGRVWTHFRLPSPDVWAAPARTTPSTSPEPLLIETPAKRCYKRGIVYGLWSGFRIFWEYLKSYSFLRNFHS